MPTEHVDCAHAIQQAEAVARSLHMTLLDQFAIAAIASGRYPATQAYEVAAKCMEERKKHVPV